MKSTIPSPYLTHKSRRPAPVLGLTGYWVQLFLDMSLVIGLLYLLTWMKGTAFDTEYRILSVITVLLMTVVYKANHVYIFRMSLLARVMTIGKAWFVVLILEVLISFITKTSSSFSREVLIIWSLTGFLAQIITCLIIRLAYANSIDQKIPTLIIGTEKLGQQLANNIYDTPCVPDDLVGLVSDESSSQLKLECGAPILGDVSMLDRVIVDYKIKRVYLALPNEKATMVKPLYMKLCRCNIHILWAPDIFSIDLIDDSVRELGGVPTISLSQPAHSLAISGGARLPHRLKRAFDLFIAVTLLTLMSPLLVAAALAILVFEGLPIFYVSKRNISLNRSVKIFKFRTMVKDAKSPKYRLNEKYLKDGYLDIPLSDEVYTPVGRILERLQIVELLQLINIIKDGMTFVGNRPLPGENMELLKQFPGWGRRFESPAGITGITQVVGKFNLTAEDRIRLEKMYSALYCSHHGNILLCDFLIVYFTMIYILSGVPLSIDYAIKLIKYCNHGEDL